MTEKSERIQVRKVELAFLKSNIDDVISQLQDWKNEGWEGITEGDCIFVELYKHRLETDEEYNHRMSNEKLMKERDEAQRRKQYEQLKREFDND